MRRLLKLTLRIGLALGLAWLTLLGTALWADQNPEVAALFWGDNIVFQLIVTIPAFYLALGRLPIFVRTPEWQLHERRD
jgi:hypothetical protein